MRGNITSEEKDRECSVDTAILAQKGVLLFILSCYLQAEENDMLQKYNNKEIIVQIIA